MDEKDIKQAHDGLHLACSALITAANAFRRSGHPDRTTTADEIEAMHHRCVALINELNDRLAFKVAMREPQDWER